MLLRQDTFTATMGEYGYLIALGEDYDWPQQMPYGWRCGPVTPSTTLVMATTDTGPVQLTVQLHDTAPPQETAGWEPMEEMSLHAEDGQVRILALDPGEFNEQWPKTETPPHLPAAAWVRMRLYCHVDSDEPGLGDRGERHLVQLWEAPQAPAVHPELTDADIEARAAYAQEAARPVEEYTHSYTVTYERPEQ